MNRKILRRQIESEAGGIWQNAEMMEADDGLTALEVVRTEMAAGRGIDFILMDYVMVSASRECSFIVLKILLIQHGMNGLEAVKTMRTSLGFHGVVLGMAASI